MIDDHEDEIWYPIPGFPDYEFSSDQRVRSSYVRGARRKTSETQKSILKPINLHGYAGYPLMRDGVRHRVYVHKIVAALAYGDTPDGLLVLHSDDDKHNNFPSNLTFGTSSDNRRDAIRNGKWKRSPTFTWKLGTDHRNSKLNDDSVRRIREMAASGQSQSSIAKKFGVSQTAVSHIVLGKTWKHVA